MADIRKNLILSAKLEDAELKKQLAVLKKEMGNSFSIDAGVMKDLKEAFKSIAKDFGNELRAAVNSIKPGKGANAAPGKGSGISQSDITNFKVENMVVANLVVRNMTGLPGSNGGSPGGGGNGASDDEEGRKKKRSPYKEAATYAALAAALTTARSIPGALTERRNRSIYEGVQGDELSSIATESAQKELMVPGAAGILGAIGGGIAGGAALGTLTGGPIGTAIGAIGGGLYGGYKAFTSAQDAGIGSNKQQIEALNMAYKSAQGINGSAVSMIRGGNVRGGEINSTLRGGAGYGFSPDEATQQFLSARSSLGNKATVMAMPELQRMAGATGADMSTLAGYTEASRGASGISSGVAAQKQAKYLETAFARGLDASKTSKFLQTNMDLIHNTTGLGTVDTDKIQSSFLNLASALAGGGPMTDRALEQAATLSQKQTNESNSLEGFAGIGNFTTTQSYIQNTDVGKVLGQEGLLTLLNTKKGEDTGVTTDALLQSDAIKARAEKAGMSRQDIVDSLKNEYVPAKNDVQMAGLNMVGDNSATRLALGLQTGQSTNEIQTRMSASGAQQGEDALRRSYESGQLSYEQYKSMGGMGSDNTNASTPDQFGLAPPSALDKMNAEQGTTEQMKYKTATSQNQAEMAITGFSTFGLAATRASEQMDKFKDAVKDATDKLRDYSANVGVGR